MSNGLFIGDKDPVEIRVGSRKATSVYYSGDNVPEGAILHISAKGLTTAGIAQSGGVTDLSGNGNNGTAYGGVEVVNDSEMGECFSFDGVDDYIRTGSNIDMPRDITFVVTVKLDKITSSAIFSNIKNVNNSWTGTDLFAYDSKFNFEDRPYKYNIPSDTIQTGIKYHVAITSNSVENKSKMFINGELVKTATKTFTGYSNFSRLTIGADSNNSNRVKGLISEVKIFPYALTSEQVQALYRGIKKVWSNVPQNPVLHISAKGLTTAGIAQSGGVTDLSGNGNNGTAYGGVEVVNDDEMGECFEAHGSGSGNIMIFGQKTLPTTCTLHGRIKLNKFNDYAGIVSWRDATHGIILTIETSTGKAYIGDRLSSGSWSLHSPKAIPLNTWVTLTGVFGENGSILYIDGVPVATTSNKIVSSGNSPLYVIGRINPNHNTRIDIPNGLISEVKIFPYALTAHEVMKLYRASRR
jgi:hypothetical protein